MCLQKKVPDPLNCLDELEIRRLFITDECWNRAGASWKELRPFRNFNKIDETDETEIEYCERLRPKYDFPLEVLSQWIFSLYYDRKTINNYSWIDYQNVEFKKVDFTIEQLSELHIIEDSQDYVNVKKSYQPFDEFPCCEEDLEHWKKYNTWTVPPVVLDANSLKQIPSHAEIVGPYQLIEGHTRLGLLLAMQRTGLLEKKEHSVYLLSQI